MDLICLQGKLILFSEFTLLSLLNEITYEVFRLQAEQTEFNKRQ